MSNKNKNPKETETETETETMTLEPDVIEPETETRVDINKGPRDMLIASLVTAKMDQAQADMIGLATFPIKYSEPKAPTPNAICRALSTLASLNETEKVKSVLSAHPFKTIQKRVEYTDTKKGTYHKWETSKDTWTLEAQYKEIMRTA